MIIFFFFTGTPLQLQGLAGIINLKAACPITLKEMIALLNLT